MRVCVFCEHPASTKEDAWPLWLMRRLGATKEGIIEAQRGKHTSTTWRANALRIGFVCETCNSGWMSQLEQRVQPIVGKLLSEESVILDRNEQMVLATWACKNAMVFEALRQSASWFFTNAERRVLRDSLTPPSQTSVWIAKCVEHRGAYCKAADINGVAEGIAEHVTAYVTTMGFGPLALQVVSTRLPDSILPGGKIMADLRPGPWDQVVLQIWPFHSEHIFWPATIGLSGELGLDTFGERWSPISP